MAAQVTGLLLTTPSAFSSLVRAWISRVTASPGGAS